MNINKIFSKLYPNLSLIARKDEPNDNALVARPHVGKYCHENGFLVEHISVFYLRLRYSITESAMQAKISGNIAKGPRPKARNPKTHCIIGLEAKA